MANFEKLVVWQSAYQLTLMVYQITNTFPAEGSGRGSDPDFRRFCQVALGSSHEVEFFVILAHDLRYLAEQSYHQLLNKVLEVQRMLAGFIQRLKES